MTTPTGHILIGDRALEKIERELKAANINLDLRCLRLANGLQLSFSEIIALGGDFYGVPGKPIALEGNKENQEERFRKAYETLDKSSISEVRKFLAVFREEKTGIEECIRTGKKPHNQHVGDDFWQSKDGPDAFYRFISLIRDQFKGVLDTIHTYPNIRSNYLDLFSTNIDHFGEAAKAAYLTGHRLAMKTAEDAAKEENEEAKSCLLQKAFAMEAFASHFLSDSFSAGHIRVPRVAIYEHYRKNHGHLATTIPLDQVSAWRLASIQHEEDGKNGVYAKVILNGNEQVVQLVGDDYFCDAMVNPRNPRNLEVNGDPIATVSAAAEAVAAGMREVIGSYTHRPVSASSMGKYFPVEVCEKNFAPLYRVNGVLQKRENRVVGLTENILEPGVEIVRGYRDSEQWQYREYASVLPTENPPLARVLAASMFPSSRTTAASHVDASAIAAVVSGTPQFRTGG